MLVLTTEQMKKAENISNNLGVSYLRLMKNAGAAAFMTITSILGDDLNGRHFVVLCGNGNNGGDGFVLASRLAESSDNVTIVLMNSLPLTESAESMYDYCKQMQIEILDLSFDINLILSRIRSADIIIDAIFGIGFHGEMPDKMATVIDAANSADCDIYSLDIPSGCNADSGKVASGSIVADKTIVFGALKIGQLLPPCCDMLGEVHIVEIGLPARAIKLLGNVASLINLDMVKDSLPRRDPSSHKGNYGRLLNIAGSVRMSGAAALSTLAALRCGVGICTLATPKQVISSLSSGIFESLFLPLESDENGFISRKSLNTLKSNLHTAQAISIGMGLGVNDDAKIIVREVINCANVPIILDADGINCIADDIDILKDTNADIVITPHPGEMARLLNITTDEVQANRHNLARDFAMKMGITVVLKGRCTIVATPDGTIYFNTNGNAGLARGGSGDVLSGMIGAFLAQGISTVKAATMAVFLHGLCADRIADRTSMQGMLPSDIIAELPDAFALLER